MIHIMIFINNNTIIKYPFVYYYKLNPYNHTNVWGEKGERILCFFQSLISFYKNILVVFNKSDFK